MIKILLKEKKVLLAAALAMLLPILFTLITGKPENQVTKLLSAIPCEILLVIAIGYLCYTMGFKNVGLRKPKYLKLFYLIPELLLIFIIITTMIKVPSVAYSNTVILKLLVLAMLVGIYEELLSRGLVLHLFARGKSPIIAIVCSGLFFGFLHISNFQGTNGIETYFQVVETIAAGIYGAVLTLTLRSIVPLMITHFLYDFFLFISLYFTSLEPVAKSTAAQASIFSFSAYIMPLMYLFIAGVVYLIERKNIRNYVSEISDGLKNESSNYKKFSPFLTVLITTAFIFLLTFIRIQ